MRVTMDIWYSFSPAGIMMYFRNVPHSSVWSLALMPTAARSCTTAWQISSSLGAHVIVVLKPPGRPAWARSSLAFAGSYGIGLQLRVADHARAHDVAGARRVALHHALDVGVAVGGERGGPAHLRLLERRLELVEAQPLVPARDRGEDLDAVALRQPRHLARRDLDDDVRVARLQRGHAPVQVRDRRDDDPVHEGLVAPVGVVPHRASARRRAARTGTGTVRCRPGCFRSPRRASGAPSGSASRSR